MIFYNEEEIKAMRTVNLKIICQPFFYAHLTATQVLARWEIFYRYNQVDVS